MSDESPTEFYGVSAALAYEAGKKHPMPLVNDPTGRAEVVRGVDRMARQYADAVSRFWVASEAGAKLAAAVYDYLEDPVGVNTHALAAAREEFMGLHSGNFVRT